MRMKNLNYLLTGYLLFLSICTSSFYAQEVGIIMGTARQMMQNPEEGLIKLKEMGIKHIEGAGARGMSRVEYKKLLDKHGFDVVASGVTFEKIEIPDSIKPIIENLKFYGAEYAVCYWICLLYTSFPLEIPPYHSGKRIMVRLKMSNMEEPI